MNLTKDFLSRFKRFNNLFVLYIKMSVKNMTGINDGEFDNLIVYDDLEVEGNYTISGSTFS